MGNPTFVSGWPLRTRFEVPVAKLLVVNWDLAEPLVKKMRAVQVEGEFNWWSFAIFEESDVERD